MIRQKQFIALVCCVVLAMATSVMAQLGGWSKADVDDPEVMAAAKFALGEKQKTTDAKLTFKKIVSAKQQLVSGMNYAVTMKVTTGGDKPTQREAEAVVYKNLDDEYSLTSWSWNNDG